MKVGELLFDVNVNGDDAKKSIEGIKSGFSRLTDFAKGTAVAITGVASTILGISKSAVNSAVEIDNMSKRFGVSSDQIQKLQLQFEQNNLSAGDMESTLDSITSKVSDYAQTGQNAYAKLGISMTKSDGSLKNSMELYQELISNIGKIPEANRRATLSGLGLNAQLVNMIGAGKADTKGKIVSKADIQGLNDLGTEMTKLEETSKTTLTKLAANLVPVIKPLVDEFTDWMISMQSQIPKIAGYLKEWIPYLIQIGKWVLIFLVAMKGLSIAGSIFGMLKGGFGTIISLVRVLIPLMTTLFANPVVLAFTGVLLAGIAIFEAYKNNFLGFGDIVDSIGGKLQKYFVTLWDDVKNVFSDIGNLMEGVLQFDPKKITLSLKAIGTDVYNFLNDLLGGIPDMIINTFKNALIGMFQSVKGALKFIGVDVDKLFSDDGKTSGGVKLDNSGATMSTNPLSTSNSLITNNQSSQINNDHSNKSKTTTNNIYITGSDVKQNMSDGKKLLSNSTGEN